MSRDLDSDWKEGAIAFRGSTVSGFPNMFIMTGPNTALGHNSMIYMIEAQAHYVMDALRQLAQRPARALDVLVGVQWKYNLALQQRLAKTVWNTGGCNSWYRSRNGLNTTLWPDFTFVFARQLGRFDVENYRWLSAGQADNVRPEVLPPKVGNPCRSDDTGLGQHR